MASAKAAALYLSLASLLVLPLLSHGATKVYIAQSNRQPLLDLKKAFKTTAARLKNWDFKNECKKWDGVTCDSYGRVTKLTFYNEKFSSLSSSIGSLTALTSLTFGNCSLTGKIPSTIGKLSKLTVLNLQDNKLSGFIPEELFKCTKLEILSLEGNLLYGPLSTSIRQLTKLSSIDVLGNYLQGPIPPLAPSVTKTISFDFNGNYFNYNNLNVEVRSPGDYIFQNCLRDAKPEVEVNRPDEECAQFCNAGSSRGPCGGNGYCYFDKSTPKCLCNTGYKAKGATCIKS